MSSAGSLVIFLLFGLSSLAAYAQASPPVAPLPADPLELATGPTLVVDTPENRSLVLNLLERARQNGSVLLAPAAPPFTLRVSFTSNGPSGGSGEMEETKFSRQERWRWSARFGSYSQTRIFKDGIAYDEKTPGPIPLRVQMVRGAIFWSMVRVRAGATLRMAAAKWNGTDIVCALLSGDEQVSATPGRRWEEREYCVDPKSGLLRIYSEAPGIYTVYDYSDALQFHGRSIARQITIVEHGEAVLNIHLDVLGDPAVPDPSWFTPTKQMLAGGPGVILTPPVRFSMPADSPAGYGGTLQPVIIHASIDPKGKVREAESLQNSDPNLNNAALRLVERGAYSPSSGPVPTQKEAFIEVQFGAAR